MTIKYKERRYIVEERRRIILATQPREYQEKRRPIILTTAHHYYAKDLKTYAFFKIHDHTKGQDLVQDTFIKTWSYLVKGGKIEMMRAFLYHILNNLIIDEYRKRKTVSLDVLLDQGFEPSTDYSERIFNVLDGKTATLLIQHLPLKYQKVLSMKYTQGLSLKEMALITGQSRNTMAVQVHRGLERLKILYNPA